MEKCECCKGTGFKEGSKLNHIIQSSVRLLPAGAFMILNTDEIAIAIREAYPEIKD